VVVAALLGFGSFVLASLVAGARLLALARRTRQVPEAALGAALLLGGGIGYLLMVLALDVLPRSLAPPVLLAANLSLHGGALLLALGTARIFRPESTPARGAVAAIALLLAGSDVLRFRDPGAIPAGALVFWTSTLGSAAAYAWSAAEAGRCWGQLRRRLRFGLADPVVALRMGAWAAACAAAVAMHVASTVNRFLAPGGMHPAVLATSSALGLAAAAGLWLAFFPRPRAIARAAAKVAGGDG
jgi:hypothetical protein